MVSEIADLHVAVAKLRQMEKNLLGVSCLPGRAQGQRGGGFRMDEEEKEWENGEEMKVKGLFNGSGSIFLPG